jgi:DUF4097 and DUF4098 domain-containing protein YvlB
MSGVPPTPPPGGYPPYDPRTQWRIYREQQKAAMRAQRDAWRAQRYAMKAGYGGYGPRVPSIVGPLILIAIGVIWLLIYTGRISASGFWGWYGHWWPALLIFAGLALLAEWALDVRRATPVRRGGSFVGILILLAFLGLFAAAWAHMGGPWRNGPWSHGPWNQGDNDFFNMLGMPEHEMDQAPIREIIPANATIEIQNPRGNVSVTTGEATALDLMAHQVAYANSDSEASKIFDNEKASVTVSGSNVVVRSPGNDHGQVNLAVTVPPTARVTINAARGDVTVAGLSTGVTINAAHGDLSLNGITGTVTAHVSNSRHDVAAHQIAGDLTVDGNCNDMTLSEIKGPVTINGEIFGDVHIENIASGIRIHTSVTNLQLESLPGDLTLDSDTLRVNQAKGAVQVITHAKDVDLNQVYGDSSVEDRDGTVSIEPAGPYSIEARNSKGDVEITLPPDASATVEGRTRNGDIVTDYGLNVSGDENKTVTGSIGAGKAHIQLVTDNGDVRIKKGSAVPPAPPTPPAIPGAGKMPAMPPPPPGARHLKAPPSPPAAPVAQ